MVNRDVFRQMTREARNQFRRVHQNTAGGVNSFAVEAGSQFLVQRFAVQQAVRLLHQLQVIHILLHNGFAGRIYLAVVFPDVFPFAGNLVLGHRFIEQADPLLEQGAVILRFFQLGGRAADIVRQADDKAGISRRGAGRGAFGIDEHDVQLRIEAGQPAGKAYAGIAGADNHPVGFNVAA